jgi:hypothetical protein
MPVGVTFPMGAVGLVSDMFELMDEVDGVGSVNPLRNWESPTSARLNLEDVLPKGRAEAANRPGISTRPD